MRGRRATARSVVFVTGRFICIHTQVARPREQFSPPRRQFGPRKRMELDRRSSQRSSSSSSAMTCSAGVV